MRIQTNKTKLWRLARDYGAQPPGMKYTELICYESGSYGLAWPGGPKVYLTAVLGRPVLLIGEKSHGLTVDELRRRGMVSGGGGVSRFAPGLLRKRPPLCYNKNKKTERGSML